MRYELFLRGSAPLSDEDVDTIRAAADEALRVEAFRTEEHAVGGVDLGVDPSQIRAAERLCSAAFRLAAEHGLTVFDPQLGRAVTSADEDTIRRQLEQSAAFAEAAPLTPLVEERSGLSPSLRLWLIVAAFAALALVLGRALQCAAR
jgi:hypothetical protein